MPRLNLLVKIVCLTLCLAIGLSTIPTKAFGAAAYNQRIISQKKTQPKPAPTKKKKPKTGKVLGTTTSQASKAKADPNLETIKQLKQDLEIKQASEAGLITQHDLDQKNLSSLQQSLTQEKQNHALDQKSLQDLQTKFNALLTTTLDYQNKLDEFDKQIQAAQTKYASDIAAAQGQPQVLVLINKLTADTNYLIYSLNLEKDKIRLEYKTKLNQLK